MLTLRVYDCVIDSMTDVALYIQPDYHTIVIDANHAVTVIDIMTVIGIMIVICVVTGIYND